MLVPAVKAIASSTPVLDFKFILVVAVGTSILYVVLSFVAEIVKLSTSVYVKVILAPFTIFIS